MHNSNSSLPPSAILACLSGGTSVFNGLHFVHNEYVGFPVSEGFLKN